MENLKIETQILELDSSNEKSNLESEFIASDYWVYICNMSNWTITQIKNRTGQISNLTPPIAKTCNSNDVNVCIKQGGIREVLVCPCNDSSFGVMFYLVHPKGYAGWTKLVTITPSCSRPGEVIGVSIPDPA